MFNFHDRQDGLYQSCCTIVFLRPKEYIARVKRMQCIFHNQLDSLFLHDRVCQMNWFLHMDFLDFLTIVLSLLFSLYNNLPYQVVKGKRFIDSIDDL